jgi:hypothetical protein
LDYNIEGEELKRASPQRRENIEEAMSKGIRNGIYMTLKN